MNTSERFIKPFFLFEHSISLRLYQIFCFPTEVNGKSLVKIYGNKNYFRHFFPKETTKIIY